MFGGTGNYHQNKTRGGGSYRQGNSNPQRGGWNSGSAYGQQGGHQSNFQSRGNGRGWEVRGRKRGPIIGNQPGNQERERPPPNLRGRQIGLWFAGRNKAKQEAEQKKNISTITMDEEKERDIRILLSNFTQEEGATNQDAGYSYYNWQEPQAVNPAAEEYYSSGGIKNPKYARQDASQRDVMIQQEEPCDSWEEMYSTDIAQAQTSGDYNYYQADPSSSYVPDSYQADPSSSYVLDSYQADPSSSYVPDSYQSDPASSNAPDTRHQAYFDNTSGFELDDRDEEGVALPCVTGVMEYNEAHSDYPYQAGVGSDFEPVKPRVGNPALDKEMQDRMEFLSTDKNFCSMMKFREKLPSYNMRDEIIDTINNNQVVVISGETGCGKTTQVPQFILDDYIQEGIGSQCSIICTQPRRISAISVAERVAAERSETVDDSNGNNSIGYQIRLETKRPRTQGSILFCTTGIVLKYLEKDPKLERASHVIIDEIHERDLQSDFLMIILKDLLLIRHDLKVILMSATLNAFMFSEYFGNCPMLNIPGFTFPVKQYFLEQIIPMTQFTLDHRQERYERRRPKKKMTAAEEEFEESYQVWCCNQAGKYTPRDIKTLHSFDFKRINYDLVLHIIKYIMSNSRDGAILVFVPGYQDIKTLNEIITKYFKSIKNLPGIRIIPLHSMMPTVNQREVFERPPPRVRKIVIATNIAETSITIDDIVYVIDTGKIKVKGFKPEMNLASLEPQWVSKANAKQRSGRAGRVQAGYCFHLFTSYHFEMAQDYQLPEMLRTRLEELCLQIKLLKLGRIVPFISKAMQHPSTEAIQHAVNTLTEMNALDKNENLLPLGYHIARMPLEPHTAKMILFGAMFGCLDHILTIAASLNFKDAFVIPLGQEVEADRSRYRFANGTKSDHLMIINAYKGFEDRWEDQCLGNYCWDNFLSLDTLRLLKNMKRQLADVVYDLGFIETRSPKDPGANVNNDNSSMLRAILCAGLYPNVAQIIRVPKSPNARVKGVRMVLKDGSKVHAHPKSVNIQETFFESKWMIYYMKMETTKVYLYDSTMVSPFPLLFFGGKIDIKRDQGKELVTVDDWMVFNSSFSIAKLVKDLRVQLDEVLKEKIINPGPTDWNCNTKEGAIMKAIADLITTEQIGCGQEDDGSIGIPY